MSDRRKFIKQSLLSGATFFPGVVHSTPLIGRISTQRKAPLILSTWNHGVPANASAIETLKSGGSILDAVEKGVMTTELDLENLSVGLQGLPDREGIVTLDASIMKGNGECGSVAFLRQVRHPISVARKVMEETLHVMLAGEGARQFALAQGFPLEKEELSPAAKKAYEEWKKTSKYKPIINIENHDTIGMIGIGSDGKMAGSCTTSGLAYKMHGRVGDSPIIGAGLFVDDEVGAATATGLGETIIRICGSFLIVELMRQGRSPQEACEEAVRRLVAKSSNSKEIQAGFLAINKDGEMGAFAVQPGFNYAQGDMSTNELIDSKSYFN